MDTTRLHPFEGFLPPGSLVMVRRHDGVLQQQNTEKSVSAEHSALSLENLDSVGMSQEKDLTQESTHEPTQENDSLEKIAADLQGCTRCKLCQHRKTIVVGEGNPNAALVFAGEGPGEQEDLQGRPFVGKAGALLDRMIEAMGLTRGQVYILNAVKCRPPGNRNPEPDELEACSPFLVRQLAVIRPRVVVALGKFAAQTLLQTETRISELRGRFFPYRGYKLMPTFHPAFLLRNPASKREVWEDLKKVAAELELVLPARGSAGAVHSNGVSQAATGEAAGEAPRVTTGEAIGESG